MNDFQELLKLNSIDSLRILIPVLKRKYTIEMECSNRLESCLLILFGLNDGLLEQENLVQYCMLKAFIRLSESLEPIDFKILCNQNGTWSQQMIVKIIEKSFVTLMSDFQFSAGTLKLYRFWIDILIKNKAMMVSELFIRQMLKDIVQGLKSHSQPRYLKNLLSVYQYSFRLIAFSFNTTNTTNATVCNNKVLGHPKSFVKHIVGHVLQIGVSNPYLAKQCSVLFGEHYQILEQVLLTVQVELVDGQFYTNTLSFFKLMVTFFSSSMSFDSEFRNDLIELIDSEEVVRCLVIPFLSCLGCLNKYHHSCMIFLSELFKKLNSESVSLFSSWMIKCTSKKEVVKKSSEEFQPVQLQLFCIDALGTLFPRSNQVLSFLLSLLDTNQYQLQSRLCQTLAFVSINFDQEVTNAHSELSCKASSQDPFGHFLQEVKNYCKYPHTKVNMAEIKGFGLWIYYISRHLFLDCKRIDPPSRYRITNKFLLEILKLQNIEDERTSLVGTCVVWGLLVGSLPNRAPDFSTPSDSNSVPPADAFVFSSSLECLKLLSQSCFESVQTMFVSLISNLVGHGSKKTAKVDYSLIKNLYEILQNMGHCGKQVTDKIEAVLDYGQRYHTVCFITSAYVPINGAKDLKPQQRHSNSIGRVSPFITSTIPATNHLNPSERIEGLHSLYDIGLTSFNETIGSKILKAYLPKQSRSSQFDNQEQVHEKIDQMTQVSRKPSRIGREDEAIKVETHSKAVQAEDTIVQSQVPLLSKEMATQSVYRASGVYSQTESIIKEASGLLDVLDKQRSSIHNSSGMLNSVTQPECVPETNPSIAQLQSEFKKIKSVSKSIGNEMQTMIPEFPRVSYSFHGLDTRDAIVAAIAIDDSESNRQDSIQSEKVSSSAAHIQESRPNEMVNDLLFQEMTVKQPHDSYVSSIPNQDNEVPKLDRGVEEKELKLKDLEVEENVDLDKLFGEQTASSFQDSISSISHMSEHYVQESRVEVPDSVSVSITNSKDISYDITNEPLDDISKANQSAQLVNDSEIQHGDTSIGESYLVTSLPPVAVPLMNKFGQMAIHALLNHLVFEKESKEINYFDIYSEGLLCGPFRDVFHNKATDSEEQRITHCLHPLLKQVFLLDPALLTELLQDWELPRMSFVQDKQTQVYEWIQGLDSLHRHLIPISKSICKLERKMRVDVTVAQALVLIKDKISIVKLTHGVSEQVQKIQTHKSLSQLGRGISFEQFGRLENTSWVRESMVSLHSSISDWMKLLLDQ